MDDMKLRQAFFDTDDTTGWSSLNQRLTVRVNLDAATVTANGFLAEGARRTDPFWRPG